VAAAAAEAAAAGTARCDADQLDLMLAQPRLPPPPALPD
jgi:hypothetical protein